jgi:predicted AlkP superfamily phosphohydrolase/phosphomutase
MTFLPAYIGPGAGFAFAGSVLSLAAALLLSAGSLAIWPFRVAWWALRGRRRRATDVGKVIFLGLDGLDPRLTERFMTEGKMPNLARLREKGGYRRLRTTFPALSPVAWSTFATGVNPARHNIFDFLNRDLKSYLPELSSSKVRGPRRFWKIGRFRLPLERAHVEMRRKSQPFWKLLGEHRIASTILRVPITFPPEKFHGRLLSAMCTPDLKGTQGSFSLFTTRASEAPLTGGGRYKLERVNGHFEGSIEGPETPDGPLRIPFRLMPGRDGGAALDVQGSVYALEKGRYSGWAPLSFHAGPGLNARGVARFLLIETGAEVSLYASPLNIDPESPALPISHPSYYAIYLAKLMGSFATLGMAEDTWALNEGVIDEEAFLEQVYLTHAERETMFFHALDRTRRGAVACVFDATDRVQHMFHRQLTEGHGAVIEDLYRRADALVGKTLRYVDGRTVLFVLSDHGFASFRRCVDLNAWLHRNGYLALTGERLESGPYFEGVDWGRTRAYALGLGGVYFNLKGREAGGVVEPGEERAALERELVEKLSGLRDEESGETAIRQAYATSSLYKGPYLDAAPDLIAGYADGYRTSWEAATGKVGRDVMTDNRQPWSGDHAIDPPLVPGVLFANRKIDAEDPGIEDMAPTALELFGIRPPEWMEGRALFRPA